MPSLEAHGVQSYKKSPQNSKGGKLMLKKKTKHVNHSRNYHLDM